MELQIRINTHLNRHKDNSISKLKKTSQLRFQPFRSSTGREETPSQWTRHPSTQKPIQGQPHLSNSLKP